MTDSELVLFKNILESAKILHACATNLLYDLAPDKWPNGWTPIDEERKAIEAIIKEADDFVGEI